MIKSDVIYFRLNVLMCLLMLANIKLVWIVYSRMPYNNIDLRWKVNLSQYRPLICYIKVADLIELFQGKNIQLFRTESLVTTSLPCVYDGHVTGASSRLV